MFLHENLDIKDMDTHGSMVGQMNMSRTEKLRIPPAKAVLSHS